jgi:DNA mismatch endonuclease (patch repair protein)
VVYIIELEFEVRKRLRTKAPSFSGLKPVSTASSQAKRNNRSRDTTHEVMLRRALWRMGLRYRKNASNLPGKPDIIFPAARVAVFCDGDFWHGRNWQSLRKKLRRGTNSRYWVAKIESNRARDRRVTTLLRGAGWHVVRFWETTVRRDPVAAAHRVSSIVKVRKRQTTFPLGISSGIS